MHNGPFQHLLRLQGLSVAQRAIVASLIAWAPLVVMARDRVALLNDVSAYGRFLVAVPVLVLAEHLLGSRMREASEQVLQAGLVRPEDRTRYLENQARFALLNRSRMAAVVSLGLAYFLSIFVAAHVLSPLPTWAARGGAPGSEIRSAAGWWLELVSVPVFWYLALRRLWRFLVWAGFLGMLARMRLHLDATHPDRAGGLAFLSGVQGDFNTIIFAMGIVVSTAWCQQIAERGVAASRFVETAVTYVVGAPLVASLPLVIFAPHLRLLRWRGELEYGRFACRYVQAFARRWLRSDAPGDDTLLGTSDVQALSDLMNSFATVQSVQRVPITRDAVTKLLVGAGLSMLPLLLAAIPLNALFKAIAKALLRG